MLIRSIRDINHFDLNIVGAFLEMKGAHYFSKGLFEGGVYLV